MATVLVRQSIDRRLAAEASSTGSNPPASLPLFLKGDVLARISIIRRLASSRSFATGYKAGLLRTAQRRSSRPFRNDVTQRVIVKVKVALHSRLSPTSMATHVAYLCRSGAGVQGSESKFFDRIDNEVDASEVTRGWGRDRHHFRLIISPEHGDRISDLRSYTREVMERAASDLGEGQLSWLAACHFDTDQPHAHVLLRGRRSDGRDLVIARDYIGYGFRARAQEVAQERLGALSRTDVERRIWRETQSDRFTGFDRRLLGMAQTDGMIDMSGGAPGAWAALMRGRLYHLERLGLATRVDGGYRLDPALEPKLRGLQVQQEIIRARHQHDLSDDATLREFADRETGRVRWPGPSLD